ncbi:hypothetical protein ACFT08_31750 [Streptomyces rochei]|uniref:hypothetical protein n=1 Tax=Streptomyces rochei TaxID=1928 RepID=UPI003626541E
MSESARHIRPVSYSTTPGIWDEPWYRVHTEQFEAAFLPNAGQDMEFVDNVDVFVDLKDGSRWSATIITLAQVEILMKRWAASGEAPSGRYFWCSDGLIVRDPGISNMVQVLTGLRTASSHRFFNAWTTEIRTTCAEAIRARLPPSRLRPGLHDTP